MLQSMRKDIKGIAADFKEVKRKSIVEFDDPIRCKMIHVKSREFFILDKKIRTIELNPYSFSSFRDCPCW